MNQRKKWIKGHIFNQKRTIQTKSNIFWVIQLTGNIPKMMNSMFQKLLHERLLANYIDDFVIPIKTRKELEERTI